MEAYFAWYFATWKVSFFWLMFGVINMLAGYVLVWGIWRVTSLVVAMFK